MTPQRSMLALLIGAAVLLLGACSFIDGSASSARVVAYDGPRLDAEDATIQDGMFGERVGWTAQVDGDRVTLERRALCGDECSFVHRLVLADAGAGALPRFVEAAYIRSESDGGSPFETTEKPLGEGQVAIQDWNLDGVVSGMVTGDVNFVFWFDFAPFADIAGTYAATTYTTPGPTDGLVDVLADGGSLALTLGADGTADAVFTLTPSLGYEGLETFERDGYYTAVQDTLRFEIPGLFIGDAVWQPERQRIETVDMQGFLAVHKLILERIAE